MTRTRRVRFFKAQVENKPGALLATTRRLQEKHIGLLGLWAYSLDRSTGELYVVPARPEKLRRLWRSEGILQEEGVGFWLSGGNRTGALNGTLDALAGAGVNIDCIDAIAHGKEFSSFIWVDPANLDKAVQALKAR